MSSDGSAGSPLGKGLGDTRNSNNNSYNSNTIFNVTLTSTTNSTMATHPASASQGGARAGAGAAAAGAAADGDDDDDDSALSSLVISPMTGRLHTSRRTSGSSHPAVQAFALQLQQQQQQQNGEREGMDANTVSDGDEDDYIVSPVTGRRRSTSRGVSKTATASGGAGSNGTAAATRPTAAAYRKKRAIESYRSAFAEPSPSRRDGGTSSPSHSQAGGGAAAPVIIVQDEGKRGTSAEAAATATAAAASSDSVSATGNRKGESGSPRPSVPPSTTSRSERGAPLSRTDSLGGRPCLTPRTRQRAKRQRKVQDYYTNISVNGAPRAGAGAGAAGGGSSRSGSVAETESSRRRRADQPARSASRDGHTRAASQKGGAGSSSKSTGRPSVSPSPASPPHSPTRKTTTSKTAASQAAVPAAEPEPTPEQRAAAAAEAELRRVALQRIQVALEDEVNDVTIIPATSSTSNSAKGGTGAESIGAILLNRDAAATAVSPWLEPPLSLYERSKLNSTRRGPAVEHFKSLIQRQVASLEGSRTQGGPATHTCHNAGSGGPGSGGSSSNNNNSSNGNISIYTPIHIWLLSAEDTISELKKTARIIRYALEEENWKRNEAFLRDVYYRQQVKEFLLLAHERACQASRARVGNGSLAQRSTPSGAYSNAENMSGQFSRTTRTDGGAAATTAGGGGGKPEGGASTAAPPTPHATAPAPRSKDKPKNGATATKKTTTTTSKTPSSPSTKKKSQSATESAKKGKKEEKQTSSFSCFKSAVVKQPKKEEAKEKEKETAKKKKKSTEQSASAEQQSGKPKQKKAPPAVRPLRVTRVELPRPLPLHTPADCGGGRSGTLTAEAEAVFESERIVFYLYSFQPFEVAQELKRMVWWTGGHLLTDFFIKVRCSQNSSSSSNNNNSKKKKAAEAEDPHAEPRIMHYYLPCTSGNGSPQGGEYLEEVTTLFRTDLWLKQHAQLEAAEEGSSEGENGNDSAAAAAAAAGGGGPRTIRTTDGQFVYVHVRVKKATLEEAVKDDWLYRRAGTAAAAAAGSGEGAAQGSSVTAAAAAATSFNPLYGFDEEKEGPFYFSFFSDTFED